MNCKNFETGIERIATEGIDIKDLENKYKDLYLHLSTCKDCLKKYIELIDFYKFYEDSNKVKEFNDLYKSIFINKIKPNLINVRKKSIIEMVDLFVKDKYPNYVEKLKELIKSDKFMEISPHTFSFARGRVVQDKFGEEMLPLSIIKTVIENYGQKSESKKLPEKEIFKKAKTFGASDDLALQLAKFIKRY